MQNFRSTKEQAANVVLFDGLSIPQEDVYKSPSLLYKQPLSNPKFFKTYENGFKNKLKVNKNTNPLNIRVQSEKWNGKGDDLCTASNHTTSVQKFNENIDTSVNNSISCRKAVALTIGKEELNKFSNTLPEQTEQWKINGEIAHKLASSTFVSSPSLMNQSVLSEDAYFYKVDPSKLVLTDVDYIRAKCRWNYKHFSDYALNPKAIERIRYLDMFTQCFSLRNVENNYNNMDNELTSTENINSDFGEGDDFDLYEKQRYITYDTSKVIHNSANIVKQENYVDAKEENINSIFKSNTFNPSIPNIIHSSTLPQSCDTSKNPLSDTLINTKFDRNNCKFKTLIPQINNSRKSFCNTDTDVKKFSNCSSSNTNKKSKNCFTTSSFSNGRSVGKNNLAGSVKYFSESTDKLEKKDYYLENTKSDSHPNAEIVNKTKCLMVSEKDITHALIKPQHSRNYLFKDEETQYKKTDYEQANNIPEKEGKHNSSNVSNIINEGRLHKSKHNSLPRNCSENLKKVSRINYCTQESNHKKTKRYTSAEKLNEVHKNVDENSEKHEENAFHNNNSFPKDEKMEEYAVKDKKTPEKCLAAKYYPRNVDMNYDGDKILYNKKNYASGDENFEENQEEGSEFSESTCSSLDGVTAKNTELLNKYFLNEFIMGVLRTDKKERKSKLYSNKNKESLQSNTKFVSSSNAYFGGNENGNINMDVHELCQECEIEEQINGKKLNKECTHNCNKLNGNKKIILVDYKSDTNNSIYKNISKGVRQMQSTKHFFDTNGNLSYTRNQIKNKKINEDSGSSTEELNSSYSDSKLTTILEGSGGISEPYEIRLRILGTSDSINKTERKSGVEEPSGNFRQSSEFKADMVDSDDMKNKTSASSINESSESSISITQVKTRKSKKLTKRKVKKHQHEDSRKSNDNIKIGREKRKQIYSKTRKNACSQNNNNTGQNVYVSCWKKYCTIL